jgi:hypothetical protein
MAVNTLRVVAASRLLVAAMILAAVIATFAETASRIAINPFNFFGYFTVQSNLIGCCVLILSVVAFARDRSGSRVVLVARACATTYLIVVGVVYAVLLAPLGAAGGVPLPWANVVMHIVVPIYMAIDWVLAPDRQRIPWAALGVSVSYPLLWCLVVLIRGATDGWVPYPFLDPSNGYASVAFYVALITVVVAGVGAGVWALSRCARAPQAQNERGGLRRPRPTE